MGQHASRAAVQAAPRGKPQRFSPPMAAQATARPQPQPSSSAMEERNPSCPAEAKEKDKLPQEPTSVPPGELGSPQGWGWEAPSAQCGGCVGRQRAEFPSLLALLRAPLHQP